jgi:hypothetical protein
VNADFVAGRTDPGQCLLFDEVIASDAITIATPAGITLAIDGNELRVTAQGSTFSYSVPAASVRALRDAIRAFADARVLRGGCTQPTNRK